MNEGGVIRVTNDQRRDRRDKERSPARGMEAGWAEGKGQMAGQRAKTKGLIVTVIQCCMWDRSMTAEDQGLTSRLFATVRIDRNGHGLDRYEYW